MAMALAPANSTEHGSASCPDLELLFFCGYEDGAVYMWRWSGFGSTPTAESDASGPSVGFQGSFLARIKAFEEPGTCTFLSFFFLFLPSPGFKLGYLHRGFFF
jgi:hypothetical protein